MVERIPRHHQSNCNTVRSGDTETSVSLIQIIMLCEVYWLFTFHGLLTEGRKGTGKLGNAGKTEKVRETGEGIGETE